MELREPRGAASARRLILVLASLAGGGCFATVDLSGLSGPPGDVPTPPTALSPTPEAGLDGAVTADSAAGNGKDAGVGDAQPWTAIASSTAPGSDAAWMLDGIGETAWSSNGPQNNNTTVTVDLGEPRTFDSVVVRAPDGLSYPQGFNFYVSDTLEWGPWTMGRSSAIQVPEQVTTIKFGAVTKRRFTIQVDGARSNPLKIAEIEVYLGPDRL